MTAGPRGYAPASRRPIADAFRATGRPAVRLCLAWGVPADAVSLASLGASALAFLGLLLASRHPWLLLAAPLALALRLWLNMLDGMVALAAGTASPRGELLNELPDRFSDVLVFAGVAHGGLASPLLAYPAAVGALLTAYVGTLGQAVAGHREYGGWMAKPARMVLVALGAWTTWALQPRGGAPAPGTWTPLDGACALVVLGCLQTVAVRLRATLRRLEGG